MIIRHKTLLCAATAILIAVGCNNESLPTYDIARADEAIAAKRLPDADHGGAPLSTDMTGAQEAPGPGDPDGFGRAELTFNPGQREVCFTLTAENIAPAAASHIHIAPAGTPGPIVVPLVPPTDGSSSGCVEDVDRSLILDILRNPEEYYVNVHNADFPPGAIRGQLSRMSR